MKKMRLIPDVIRKMDEAYEESDVLKYENMLARMFISPLLFLGAITVFLSRLFVLHEDWKTCFFDSVVLFLSAVFCELYGRKAKNEKIKAHVFSDFFSVMLIFMVLRLYYITGPAVWTFAVILILVSLLRVKKDMLITVSFVILALWIYVWAYLDAVKTGPLFHFSQMVAFAYVIFIAVTVHKLIYNRFIKNNAQLQRIFASEAKLKSTLTSVGDGVISVDANGAVDYLNPVAENLTGWTLEEAQGKPFEIGRAHV